MTAETFEGEVVEVTDRALVVQQPGQSLVASEADPGAMVAVASRLASALKDIVERQKLYAVIQGKKYPQVEAWMTIARLDNVVAREPLPPIRHEDGSYEAFAELIRLSDGMVIGSSSALCGTPDDKPWGGRAEPARRSMAQTRATSRAFRQQYSWIMALAGYEPTPAEEMPRDDDRTEKPTEPVAVQVSGTVKRGDGNGMDMSLRETPDGHAYGFKLTEVEGLPSGRRSTGVRCFGLIAVATAAINPAGEHVTVRGFLRGEFFEKTDGSRVAYEVIVADAIVGEEFTIPGAHTTPEPVAAPEPPTGLTEAESAAIWAELDRVGA